MQSLPSEIATAEELDDLLSRPSEALIEMIARLDGDIMILGAGGKMGPTLARMASRAIERARVHKQVIAVGRRPMPDLEKRGIQTIACDLLDLEAVRRLPRAENVVYMVGRKFGSTGAEAMTWAANVIAAHHAASVFAGSRIAAFSTGNVYPLLDVATGGATEETPLDPVGEYAQSCVGRERVFDYFSQTAGTRVIHIRLNYAVEMRYGVLADIAAKVWRGEAVDVATGYANVIWQGDACDHALRSLELAASPSRALNVTGPEIISVRETAREFGRLFGKEARITGKENGRAYLSNPSRAISLFGPPSVPLSQMMQWTARWMMRGGESLGKPTHFETQDGRY